MFVKTLAAASILFFAASASAASLKDRKAFAAEDEAMKSEVESANSACGIKLKASINWDTFTKNKAVIDGVAIGSSFCGDGLGAIRHLCSDAMGKAEVAKKVKSFVCTYGGPGKRTAKLAGGTFTVAIDLKASNNLDFYKEQLENSL